MKNFNILKGKDIKNFFNIFAQDKSVKMTYIKYEVIYLFIFFIVDLE
jgi:hypothetical protein